MGILKRIRKVLFKPKKVAGSCPICGVVRTSENSYGSTQTYCKSCLSKYNKKRYSGGNRGNHGNRGYYLEQKFGITSEDYKDMMEAQGGTCAICNGKNAVRKRATFGNKPFTIALAVDHNHKTGKVRGLLCNSCNTSLGKFKDDITLLKRAIEYLEETSEKEIAPI